MQTSLILKNAQLRIGREYAVYFRQIGAVLVDVEFDYTPGCKGDSEEPGYQACAEIDKIILQAPMTMADLDQESVKLTFPAGTDITEILSYSDTGTIDEMEEVLAAGMYREPA